MGLLPREDDSETDPAGGQGCMNIRPVHSWRERPRVPSSSVNTRRQVLTRHAALLRPTGPIWDYRDKGPARALNARRSTAGAPPRQAAPTRTDAVQREAARMPTYWFWRAWDLGREPVGSTGEHYRRRPCYHRSAHRTRSHLEPAHCARAVRVRDAEVLGDDAASERSVV
jgi:hypothetical protein